MESQIQINYAFRLAHSRSRNRRHVYPRADATLLAKVRQVG